MINNLSDEDKWWASLLVKEKERIALKIRGKICNYPLCTELWESLPKEKKQQIKDSYEAQKKHISSKC